MTTGARAGATLAAGWLSGVVLLSQASGGGGQTQFRSATDLVSVDVTVRTGDRPIPGLAAADFVLLDNGARQRLESVEPSRMPLDVSLLVDVSGGSPQWWGTPRPTGDVIADLNDMVAGTAAVLDVNDRLGLTTIDTYAREVRPLQPARGGPPIVGPLATAGLASLNDALAAAMLRPVDPGRRHLVVVRTQALDSISVLDDAGLRGIASRSEAIVHIVSGTSLIGDTLCRFGCTFPRRQFWRPVRRSNSELALAEVAASTGGAFHGFNAFGLYRNFVGQLKDVIDGFRGGYVLRYVPQSGRREGWHQIEVSVPGHPGAVVTARRGYAVEAVADSRVTARASPERRGGDASTPESIVELFTLGDSAGLRAAWRQSRDPVELLRDIREAGNPWPASPRRESVFILEVIDAALQRRTPAMNAEVTAFLQQHHRLVRQPYQADAFECFWYWAEAAVLSGHIAPLIGLPMVEAAMTRCPREPRLALARAFFTDQRWPVGSTTTWPGQLVRVMPNDEQRLEVPRRYAAATQFPDAAVEARVRSAWFAHRTGQDAEALALLTESGGMSADRQVVYLSQLVRGHVLRALGRPDDATAAFRAALTTWPGAQSARVSLMTLLALEGDRDEAAALSTSIQTDPDQFDPWWMYWQGDYRAFPAILARLKTLAQ